MHYRVDREFYDIEADKFCGDMAWTFNEFDIRYPAELYVNLDDFSKGILQDAVEDGLSEKYCAGTKWITIYKVYIEDEDSLTLAKTLALCTEEEGKRFHLNADLYCDESWEAFIEH